MDSLKESQNPSNQEDSKRIPIYPVSLIVQSAKANILDLLSSEQISQLFDLVDPLTIKVEITNAHCKATFENRCRKIIINSTIEEIHISQGYIDFIRDPTGTIYDLNDFNFYLDQDHPEGGLGARFAGDQSIRGVDKNPQRYILRTATNRFKGITEISFSKNEAERFLKLLEDSLRADGKLKSDSRFFNNGVPFPDFKQFWS